MPDVAEKLHAYMLFDIIREDREGVDVSGFTPDHIPVDGEIVMRHDFPGTGTHAFRFEDGPITWHASGIYITSGTNAEDQIAFDFGASRVLNLISIGMKSEEVLKDQIHDVLDKLKSITEELVAKGADIETHMAAIDLFEKNLWRRH